MSLPIATRGAVLHADTQVGDWFGSMGTSVTVEIERTGDSRFFRSARQARRWASREGVELRPDPIFRRTLHVVEES